MLEVAIRGLQAARLHGGSAARLITRLMRGEGDPANSLSALPPLGVTVGLARGPGYPTKTGEATWSANVTGTTHVSRFLRILFFLI